MNEDLFKLKSVRIYNKIKVNPNSAKENGMDLTLKGVDQTKIDEFNEFLEAAENHGADYVISDALKSILPKPAPQMIARLVKLDVVTVSSWDEITNPEIGKLYYAGSKPFDINDPYVEEAYAQLGYDIQYDKNNYAALLNKGIVEFDLLTDQSISNNKLLDLDDPDITEEALIELYSTGLKALYNSISFILYAKYNGQLGLYYVDLKLPKDFYSPDYVVSLNDFEGHAETCNYYVTGDILYDGEVVDGKLEVSKWYISNGERFIEIDPIIVTNPSQVGSKDKFYVYQDLSTYDENLHALSFRTINSN